MSEKNRRILLVIVLILTVVWAGYNYPFGSKRKHPGAMASAPQTAQRQAQSAEVAGVSATASILDTLPEISEAELAQRFAEPWPRDPFYKRHKKKSARKKQIKRSYKLKAIIYDDASPSAYLNGRVVRQGDNISGATVIKISPNSVTLRIGQEYQKIKLK